MIFKRFIYKIGKIHC